MWLAVKYVGRLLWRCVSGGGFFGKWCRRGLVAVLLYTFGDEIVEAAINWAFGDDPLTRDELREELRKARESGAPPSAEDRNMATELAYAEYEAASPEEQEELRALVGAPPHLVIQSGQKAAVASPARAPVQTTIAPGGGGCYQNVYLAPAPPSCALDCRPPPEDEYEEALRLLENLEEHCSCEA